MVSPHIFPFKLLTTVVTMISRTYQFLQTSGVNGLLKYTVVKVDGATPKRWINKRPWWTNTWELRHLLSRWCKFMQGNPLVPSPITDRANLVQNQTDAERLKPVDIGWCWGKRLENILPCGKLSTFQCQNILSVFWSKTTNKNHLMRSQKSSISVYHLKLFEKRTKKQNTTTALNQ